MSTGWVSIHRKLQDNPIWTSEPFTRGQAWVDLILLANHERGYIYVRDHKIEIERGQVGWSQNRLANRWQWSRTKVRKFLQDLEKEQQIKQEKSKSYTVITLINYDEYQSKKQQKNKSKTTEKQQKNTNNNVNNDNNGNKYSDEFDRFWDLYDVKKGKKKAWQEWRKLSEDEKEKVFKNVPIFLTHFSSKQYTPRPRKYLYNRYWEDEDYQIRQNAQSENGQMGLGDNSKYRKI